MEECGVDEIWIALIVFVCVFGCALFGRYLRSVLPEDHFSDKSVDVIKLSTGLVSTMAALVLGLLISSAKGSFDTMNSEIVRSAASVVRLDRVLAKYGPETQGIRALLKNNFGTTLGVLSSGDTSRLALLKTADSIGPGEDVQREIEELSPHNAIQRQLQLRARQLADDALGSRWLALLQEKGSLPTPLLVLLVSWLAIIFGTFGALAPRNGTVIVTLLMCAIAASGAILVIMEMKMPLGGVVRISLEPMRAAFAVLGQ
jgi:hypothetical protein